MCPSFHDSTPDRSVVPVFAGAAWVWLGGTLYRLVPDSLSKLAHCWVLRRHLLQVFLGTISGLAGLTRSVALFVGCGRGGGVRVGVWLCVECCIVDASILLWSSV